MRALVAALLIAFASPAQATQDAWPALHDVWGVASDDVLNIRAAPEASAAIIGALAHDQTNVEVLYPTDDESWGLVNTGEGTGWVSLRYLDRHPEQWTYSFPDVAVCHGTEPFWTLSVKPEVALLTPLEESTGTIERRMTPVNKWDRFALVADFEGRVMQAVITRQECSDGMSDRAFGIEVNAFFGDEFYFGCCSLTR